MREEFQFAAPSSTKRHPMFSPSSTPRGEEGRVERLDRRGRLPRMTGSIDFRAQGNHKWCVRRTLGHMLGLERGSATGHVKWVIGSIPRRRGVNVWFGMMVLVLVTGVRGLLAVQADGGVKCLYRTRGHGRRRGG